MAVATLRYTDADGDHTVLLNRVSISLGRSVERDVVVSDSCVSRLHAVIERKGDVYTVVDQNSTYGTYLNAVRVQRGALHQDDLLQLGSRTGIKISFHCEELIPAQTVARDYETTGIAKFPVSNLLSSLHELRPPGEAAPRATSEMEQLNWLLRAARRLNEGVAIEDTLAALLQVTLQLTGVERGFVFLHEEGGMRLALGLNADGERLEEDSAISRRAMQRALDGELKFFLSDTLADQDAAEWPSVVANRIRSIYCIPLRKRLSGRRSSQILGLLYLDSQVSPVGMTEVDHQLLDTLATEAAALLHNALLAEEEHKARHAREELAVAATIHSGLMSRTLPVLPYAVLRAKSVPCLAIGGDFYDVVALPECVCVTVADVSGKGVSAAIVAATLQGIIHSQLLAGQPLDGIASLVNQFLYTRNVGKYATMVMLRLWRDGRAEWINCGHVQPLAARGGEIRRLEEGNLVVGLIEGAKYACAEFRMRPGERVVIATDGVTEAENLAGDCFGYEGLMDACRNGCLDSGVEDVLEAAVRFQKPGEAQDDCTLLEIGYTGH